MARSRSRLVLGLAAAAGLAAGLAGRCPTTGEASVKDDVVTFLRTRLPGLRIGRIEAGLGRLTLHQVTVSDRFGGRAIHIARADLSYRLLELLSRRMHIERLLIVEPRVVVRKARSGRVNLSELLVPSTPSRGKKGDAPQWTVRVDALEVQRGGARIHSASGEVVEVEGVSLAGRFRSGARGITLSVDRLEGRTRGLRVRASGSASLGRTVEARLAARVIGSGPGRLRGPLRITGRATGTARAINITGALRAPGGALASVSGWFRGGRYSLSTTVAQLDPRRLLRGAPPARLGLTLRIAGAGVPVLAPSGRSGTPKTPAETDVALALHPSRISGFAVDGGTLRGRLSGKRWKLHAATLTAGRSSLRLAGSGTTDGAALELRLRGSFPRLARLERLLPAPLRGAVELDGRLSRAPPRPMTLSLDVTGRRLAVAGRDQVIQRAVVALKGTPEQLTLQASARGPRLAGRLDATATTTFDGPRPRRVDLHVRRLFARLARRQLRVRGPARLRYVRGQGIRVARLVIAALGGTAAITGSYDGREARIAAQLVGVRLSDGPALAGRLRAAISSSIADLHARLAAGEDLLEVDARLPVRFVGGSLVPSLAPARQGRLAVRGRLGLGALRRLAPGLPRLPGTGRLELDARGSLDEPLGDLRLAVRDTRVGSLGGLDLDLHLQARRDSVALTARGRGQRELARVSLALSAAPRDLIAALRQRRPDLLHDLPSTLSLSLASLPVGELHPALREQGGGLLSGTLDLQGSPRRSTTRLALELAHARWRGRAIGPVTARGTFTGAARRTEGALVLAGRPGRSPLSLRLAGQIGAGLVSFVEGRPLADAEIRLRAASSEVDLAGLSPRLRRLRGRAKLTGSASGPLRAPRARARLEARDVKLDAVSVGAITASAVYGDGKLSIALDQPGVPAPRRLHGTLQVDLDGRRTIAGRLGGAALASSLLPVLPSAVWHAGGSLGIDLGLSGTLDRPELSGTFRLTRGELSVLGLRSLRDLRFTVRARAGRIELSRLEGRTSEGYVRGAGRLTASADAPAWMLALDLHVARLAFDVGAVDKALFSGRVAVKGSLRSGRLPARRSDAARGSGATKVTARVAVREALVEMPGLDSRRGLGPSRLPADVVFVDRRGPAGRPPVLDLRLSADPITLRDRRRRELDLTVAAALRARTDRRGKLRVSGSIRGDRGKVTLFGNAFSLRHARVRFDGGEELDPAVDVRLARRVTDATLLVDVRGTLASPEVKLGCDPPAYDQAQIMSLMVTGRVDARPPDSSSSDRSMAIASALLQATVGASAERFLSRILGFDVRFRVNLDEQRAQQPGGATHVRARPELGLPITDWFYVGGRTVVGAGADENSNEALLELRVPGSWAPTVTALFGDAAVGGLDLMWSFLF